MTYIAFLRGVNVGGKGIVSMAAIKEALVALGQSDVRTYINSGNVIFSTRTVRTYVLLLWKELDDLGILDRLPIKPGVDELKYTPGAVVWRVDRENVGRSQMNRIVGTPLYKKITIRSANTMRKLNDLTATPARLPKPD